VACGTLRRLDAGGHLTSYVVPSEEGPQVLRGQRGRAVQLAASTGTWRSFTDAMDKLLGAEGQEAA
jgi:PadR family transcriptional regulator PadR